MKILNLLILLLKGIIVLPLAFLLGVLVFSASIIFVIDSLIIRGQVKTGQVVYLLKLGSENLAKEIKLIDEE